MERPIRNGYRNFRKTICQTCDCDHGARPRNRTSTGDLILIAAVIALGILGLLMLYSASTDFSLRNYSSPTYMFNKQLLWIAIGMLMAFVVSRLDYHYWQKLALPLMAVTVLSLIVVLFVKDVRNGAVRTLFGGSVQPSELAKLATILYLSVWLYSKREFMHDIQLGLFPLAFILGSIGGLIYLQPDVSATLTIFILGGLLFFLAGGDLRQIVIFCLVALVAGWLVVQISPPVGPGLSSYLAGLKDPLKSSDHVLWSLESVYQRQIVRGGHRKCHYQADRPALRRHGQYFCRPGGGIGTGGAFVLIGLYGVVLWRGLKIAEKAPDSLGSVMAAGLTFWIIIEAIVNMSMMVGLLPVAGNALPFISAGGSNLISSLTAIGIY